MTEIDRFSQGTEEIITATDLSDRLESGRPLNIKLGVDPTSPDLHLGHAVVLRKLRQFQEAGHQTYLVIGDFTASIGDPAGVNKTRPVLTEAEIRDNMRSYLDQAGKILEIEKTHVVYNSEWLKTMNLSQFIGYAMQISLTTLIEREDFSNRLRENQPVGLHELIYPLVQSIDSVHLKADIEIGGWDQRLNLLLARELQRKFGQPSQVVILMKPLIGTDGELKMSNSKNNYIGLSESPNQMFGKLMRLPDSLIDAYAESHELDLSHVSSHPRERKAGMAKGIVALYHDPEAASLAEAAFNKTFRDKEVTADLVEAIEFDEKTIGVIEAVTKSSGVSASEARRLIDQGGIKVNQKAVTDPNEVIELDTKIILQVGKHRFFELIWK